MIESVQLDRSRGWKDGIRRGGWGVAKDERWQPFDSLFCVTHKGDKQSIDAWVRWLKAANTTTFPTAEEIPLGSVYWPPSFNVEGARVFRLRFTSRVWAIMLRDVAR